MIDAVLWDFGGVFTPSPFVASRRWSDAEGLDHDVVLEVVFGPYHLDTDHPWHRVERGEATVREALEHAVAEATRRGFHFDPKGFFASLADDGVDRSIVVDKVRELRSRGLRMAIVTNNAREFAEGWRRMLPVDELFDDVVDSSAVGVRKPDPAIYRLALSRLGDLAPHRAVFLDDFGPNVDAARSLGLHGVHVEDHAAALAELDAILDGGMPPPVRSPGSTR